MLWQDLRGRRLRGVKFRRQHPIGPYFADFCSIERRLIIELDGDEHAKHEREDEMRSEFMRDRGFRVPRFWNAEVLSDLDAVRNRIDLFLSGEEKREGRTEP